jgi:C4-dicarboxylate-binding protein DctP
MADATTYANGLTLAEDRNAYDKIKAAGKAALIEPTPAERDAIRAVMVQTHKDVEGRLGRETMQALYKATEFNAGKR